MPRTIRADSEHGAEVAVSVWWTKAILSSDADDGGARRIDSSACHPARVTMEGRSASPGTTEPGGGAAIFGLVTNATLTSRTAPRRRRRTRRDGPTQTGSVFESVTHRVHAPAVDRVCSRIDPEPRHRAPTSWNVRSERTAWANGRARCGDSVSRTA